MSQRIKHRLEYMQHKRQGSLAVATCSLWLHVATAFVWMHETEFWHNMGPYTRKRKQNLGREPRDIVVLPKMEKLL